MTLSYLSRARGKRTLQTRRSLFTFFACLATLAIMLGPVSAGRGAPAQEPHRQDFSATISTPMMWTSQRVEPQRMFVNMGDHSLRLDSTGKAHVAFGGDRFVAAPLEAFQ